MKDYKLLFILGVVFLITPFLGVPEVFRNWVILIAAVILIGYSLYVRAVLKKEKRSNEESIFVESNKINTKEDHLDINPEIVEEAEEFEEKLTEQNKDNG